VCQLRYLLAAGALATRVAIVAVGAVEVLRIGDGKGQGARARSAREELGVAYATSVDALGKVALEFLLSYDVGESHFLFLLYVIPHFHIL
jgi:hypothetical protein